MDHAQWPMHRVRENKEPRHTRAIRTMDLPSMPRLYALQCRAGTLTEQYNSGRANQHGKPPSEGVLSAWRINHATTLISKIRRVNPSAAAETNCPAALKMLMDTWRSCRKTHESKPVLNDDEQGEWLNQSHSLPTYRIRASRD